MDILTNNHSLQRSVSSHRSTTGSLQVVGSAPKDKSIADSCCHISWHLWQKIPLVDMDASCMIQWWVKNRRPYQLFVLTPNEFLDVTRRMPASKISMVTYWSGRTTDVAQGGLTMRDASTAGLREQPPRPPRTLEHIPLQELYRTVPEDVRSLSVAWLEQPI